MEWIARKMFGGEYMVTEVGGACGIQGSSVTEQEVQGSSITAQEVQGSSVTAQEVQGRSVTAKEVQGSSVSTPAVEGSSITAQEIQGSSVTTAGLDSHPITAALEIMTPEVEAIFRSLVIKEILNSKNYWDIVEKGYIEPENTTAEAALNNKAKRILTKARTKDKQALLFILCGVDKSSFEKISGSNTAKQAWESLQKIIQGVDESTKKRLQLFSAIFEMLQIKNPENINDYSYRRGDVKYKIKIDDEIINELRTLRRRMRHLLKRKFSDVAVAVRESKDLSMDEFVSLFQDHELKKRQNEETKD